MSEILEPSESERDALPETSRLHIAALEAENQEYRERKLHCEALEAENEKLKNWLIEERMKDQKPIDTIDNDGNRQLKLSDIMDTLHRMGRR